MSNENQLVDAKGTTYKPGPDPYRSDKLIEQEKQKEQELKAKFDYPEKCPFLAKTGMLILEMVSPDFRSKAGLEIISQQKDHALWGKVVSHEPSISSNTIQDLTGKHIMYNYRAGYYMGYRSVEYVAIYEIDVVAIIDDTQFNTDAD